MTNAVGKPSYASAVLAGFTYNGETAQKSSATFTATVPNNQEFVFKNKGYSSKDGVDTHTITVEMQRKEPEGHQGTATFSVDNNKPYVRPQWEGTLVGHPALPGTEHFTIPLDDSIAAAVREAKAEGRQSKLVIQAVDKFGTVLGTFPTNL